MSVGRILTPNDADLTNVFT